MIAIDPSFWRNWLRQRRYIVGPHRAVMYAICAYCDSSGVYQPEDPDDWKLSLTMDSGLEEHDVLRIVDDLIENRLVELRDGSQLCVLNLRDENVELGALDECAITYPDNVSCGPCR